MTLPHSPRRGWSTETRICVLIFAAAVAVHLCLAAIGWNNTLLGPHSFRQAQTAITTYYFIHGGISFDYITPILGPPWEIPLEFPLFQACTAWFVNATGMELDLAGRLMSWLFFLSLLPACYLLLDGFRLPAGHRLLFLSVLLLSPLYIFFSRSFMIESAALSLALWFLVCFDRFLIEPRGGAFTGALVFGSLAGSVKVTTFAVFLVAALLLLIGRWRTRESMFPTVWQLLGRAFGAVIGPLILTGLWVAHATVVRHRNPEAGFLDQHFGFWSFGDLPQRLSLEFWTRTFTVWSGDIVSEAGIILIVLYYGLLGKTYRGAVTCCLIAFVSGQLIFSNLYFVHSYYFYASGVFLIAALGFALAELLSHPALRLWSRWLIVVTVLALQVSAYARTYRDFQRKNIPVPESVALLQSITKPDDTVVILGQDWDCSFAYYAHRHALMLLKVREFDPEGVARTLQHIDRSKIGAVLVDGALWRDGSYAGRAFGALEVGPRPFLFMQDLGIWVPKSRQLAVRDEFDASRFPSFTLRPDDSVTGQPRTLLARQIQRRGEFKGFHPRPIRVTAVNDFTVSTVNFKDVISAHATTELVFRPTGLTQHITGVYGIGEGAYGGKDATDGVEFVVSYLQKDGTEKVLFRRLLDPERAFSDRGMQTLDVKADVPANSEVFFRTLPGPANSFAYDWSYWGAITLE
ncbi:MAG: hypothetical protein ABIZ04_05590 [Opitutus sp.]